LAEWEAAKEEENEEKKKAYFEENQEKNQEEVKDKANKGEIFVLRRVLSGQKGVKDKQRENVFHSGFTVQRKVCSMIIDGGSCANIVSFTMIEKVGF